MLDALHLRKIDLADWVLVINPGGYIGESTAREIRYARQMEKTGLLSGKRGGSGLMPAEVEKL